MRTRLPILLSALRHPYAPVISGSMGQGLSHTLLCLLLGLITIVLFPHFSHAAPKDTPQANEYSIPASAPSGLWGYVDAKTRKPVLPARYAAAGFFQSGYAPVRLGPKRLCGLINSTGEEALPPEYDNIRYFGVFPALLPAQPAQSVTPQANAPQTPPATEQGTASPHDMHMFLVSRIKGVVSQGLFSPEAGWVLPLEYGQRIRRAMPDQTGVSVYEVTRVAENLQANPNGLRGLYAVGAASLHAPHGWLVPPAPNQKFQHIKNRTFSVVNRTGGWRQSIGILHVDNGWLMPPEPALGLRRLSDDLLLILPDKSPTTTESTDAGTDSGHLVTLCHTEKGLLLANMPCTRMDASADSSVCIIRDRAAFGLFSPNRGWIVPMQEGIARPCFVDARNGVVEVDQRLYAHGHFYPEPQGVTALEAYMEERVILITQPPLVSDTYAAESIRSAQEQAPAPRLYGLASLDGPILAQPQYTRLLRIPGTQPFWLGSLPWEENNHADDRNLIHNDVMNATGQVITSFFSTGMPDVSGGTVTYGNHGLRRSLRGEDFTTMASPYRITLAGGARMITDRRTGAPVISERFAKLEDLGGGLFAAVNSQGMAGAFRVEYGVMRPVLPFEYQRVTWVSSPEILTAIRTGEQGERLFGLITAQGRWLTKPDYIFDAGTRFYRDAVLCKKAPMPPGTKKSPSSPTPRNPAFGALDAKGQVLVPFEHDRIEPLFAIATQEHSTPNTVQFEDTPILGFLAEQNGAFAIFSAKGKRLTDYVGLRHSPPDAHGNMTIWNTNGRAAAVNLYDGTAIMTGWDTLRFVRSALFAEEKTEHPMLLLLNTSGGVDDSFMTAEASLDDTILVRALDGLYGIRNNKGKQLIACRYTELFTTSTLQQIEQDAMNPPSVDASMPLRRIGEAFLLPENPKSLPEALRSLRFGVLPNGEGQWIPLNGPAFLMP